MPEKVNGAKAVVVVLVQVFGILGSRRSSIETVCFGSRNFKWTKRTGQHPFFVLDRIWYSEKYLENFYIWCWRRMETGRTDSLKNELLQRVKKQMNILQTVKWMKANWIGRILWRNCFLKHIFEGKIRVEGTGRRGRRLGQLMDEKILEGIDHTLCWNCLERCNLMAMRYNLLDQCFQNFLLADFFWLRKISTDPHILTHVNIECPNDRYPKLKVEISAQNLFSYGYIPVA